MMHCLVLKVVPGSFLKRVCFAGSYLDCIDYIDRAILNDFRLFGFLKIFTSN